MATYNYTFGGLTINKPVLEKELHSSDGLVGKYLAKRGRLIVALAKRQVGVKTGKLKESIKMIF